ncbi:uro-adherence factor A-like [Argopecten irradians]|uniref:uro-adherence factor A-like n=1 Tax=Argopecten irradians TaxID=31199 RepID=UPI003716D9A6
MDTLAPQSVLDSRCTSREPVSWRVTQDRLTRAASPGRLTKRPSNEDLEEVLLSRIGQPYRTSFSAVTTPIKTKRHRSRSASPGASSMKSEKSSKSNKGTKHVTYNANVTVRHSDSFENQDSLDSRVDFTKTDEDFSDKKFVYSDNMADSSVAQKEEDKNMMQNRDVGNKEDYSSQIHEVTQMIVNEYSKDSTKPENEVNKITSSPKVYRTKPPLPGKGSGRGTPNGRPPPHPADVGPRNVVAWEYEHDRTITYRKAMSNHYTDNKKSAREPARTTQGDRVDRPARPKVDPAADSGQRANQSADIQPRMERSSSMPLQPQEETTNRLTPPKKTVSSSIGNFFRRLSPRLGRKSKKDRSNESMSTLSDSGHGGCASDENLSRSKFRQSFKKFLGRGSPKSKSKGYRKDGSTSSLSRSEVESLDHEPRARHVPSSSNRMLESIKQNSDREKDIYQKFKDRQSPNRPTDTRPQQPVRASGEGTLAGQTPQRNSTADTSQPTSSPDRQMTAIPDIVMDVTHAVPRLSNTADHSPQTDLSPGVLSQDIDLTVSEPSLSVTDAVDGHIGQHHGDNLLTLTSERPLSPLAASTPAIPAVKSGRRTQSEPTHDNGLNISSMPKLAESGDLPLQECTKSPSYLKLSCAVSGYGKYSQYSSYSDIEKRSPFSSVSSSRSDLLSPDTMPVSKVTSPVVRRTSSERGYEFGLISPQPLSVTSSLGSHGDLPNGEDICNGVSNGDCNGIENGHSLSEGNGLPDGSNLSEEHYPTGDPKLDGAYFLRLTELEKNSLSSHCAHVEVDLQCDEVPEEVTGKIRAAIGKANLLVNQKCKQFQELCMEHIEPSEDRKLLKVEDLQGFWDMIKLQIDSVYRMFAEIELSRQNGWKELTAHSQNSSVNSSPKSGSLSLSNASTPSGTPGSRRRAMKVKETPESSPERTEKMRAAARAREEARKRMLAEKRAAMRQKQQQKEVEIYVATDSAN